MTLPTFSSCCRGQRIENVTDLLAELRKKNPGDQAEVTVQRGQDTKTATVTLATMR
jgi:S1-C subfamily serine protease